MKNALGFGIWALGSRGWAICGPGKPASSESAEISKFYFVPLVGAHIRAPRPPRGTRSNPCA